MIKQFHQNERWIIVFVFLVSFASYTFIPFLSVYFHNIRGISIHGIVFALSVQIIMQRFVASFSVLLIPFVSLKRLLVIFLFLIAGSYFLFIFTSNVFMLSFALFFNGLGAGAFTLLSKLLLFRYCNDNTRKISLSLRNAVLNLGASLGPLVGLGFVNHVLWLFAGLFFLFCMLALSAWHLLDDVDVKEIRKKSIFSFIRKINFHVAFLYTLAILFAINFIQLDLTLPLYANKMFSSAGPTILFTINALAVAVLSLPVAHFIIRETHIYPLMVASLFLAIISFLLFPLSHGLIYFCFIVLFFSLSEIIFFPTLDLGYAKFVGVTELDAIVGGGQLMLAIGFVMGNMLGGHLYVATSNFFVSFGLILAAGSGIILLFFFFLSKKIEDADSL